MLLGMLPAVVFAKDAASYDQYANAYAIMYNGDDDLLTPDLKDTSNSGLKGDGAISMKDPSSLKRLAASAE